MSSRGVTGRWRRAVATGIAAAVISLTAAGLQPTAATSAALPRISGVAGAAAPAAIVPANWGGCWRCGGFVGFHHPFFFHRPSVFFHRPFFFHRRFVVRNDFDNDFDDRFFFRRRFLVRPFGFFP